MFSFLRLELMNWDLWDHVVFPMDEKVVVVSGPNGSGKTTLLDAIRVLLGTKTLSTSRKLGGYLRAEVKTAVIKAVVTNPLRRGHGRRPFTRRGIFEDTATLACVLESRSGAWVRRFHILPGDASMDDIKSDTRGMGPDEYTNELNSAGLPKTLLKVLALEQGETHALCRRSPVQLLEYVLEMQGDKAVLDAYEVARQNYAQSRQEHANQAERSRESERALELTARDARAFEEFRALEGEAQDIETRRLPASRWHVIGRQIAALEAEMGEARDRVDRFDAETAERIARIDGLEREIGRLEKAIVERKRRRGELLTDKEGVDGTSREVRLRLKQLEALRDRAALAPEGDVEAARTGVRAAMFAEADAERRLNDVRRERVEVELELGGLHRGQRPRLPRYVDDLAGALKGAGVGYSLVVDVLDIAVPKWQKAVESLLGRDRFTVLVEQKDALQARQLASQVRYPAYIAALERGASVDAPAGSALSVVRVSEPRVPKWLLRRLADVTLVDSVADGYKLSKESASVTPDGYKQDGRGGVYIGVNELYCGAGAGEAHAGKLKERLRTLADAEREADESRRAAVSRRVAAEAEVERLDARAQWEAAKDEHARLEADDKRLMDEKRSRARDVMDVLAETEEMTRELVNREAELKQIRHDGALGDEERRRRQVRLHELANRRRVYAVEAETLERSVPGELRTPAAGALLEPPDALVGRLAAIRERIVQYDGCKDPAILEVLGKQRADLEEQLGLLRRREQELRAGEDELGRARRSYVRVADTTVTRYSSALKALGKRAGLEVEVRSPRLVEDDDALQEAGLEVRIGFDGKRAVAVSDPKLSGGQKVLASLMLLVALTWEGENEGGGFFILDEPFAHLSVERIDHVARFIGGTRSQFLLTTPTTHNFAVFNAAQLVLTLRKKVPEMPAAPPPLYVRR